MLASKRCYLSVDKPGTDVIKPSSGFPEQFTNESPNDENSIEGLKNFAVIKVMINTIEWLYLASQGHRRAVFNILTASWVRWRYPRASTTDDAR